MGLFIVSLHAGSPDTLASTINNICTKAGQSGERTYLLKLLLGPELVAVTALLLTAVGGAGVKAGITLAANDLVAVILSGEHLKRRLNNSSPQSEDKVKGRLCN